MDSSQLLQSINQNINEGIYRSDEDGIIYVNRAFAKMFGYKDEKEVYGTKLLNLYKDPNERQRLIGLFKEKGSLVNAEVTFVKKNGEEFTGLISSSFYQNEDGKMYWDGSIRDVTDQLKERKLARENNQLLESINRNINEAIYRSINQKGLVYVNEAFVKMFGYNSQEEILKADAINLYKNAHERRILGEVLLNKGSVSNREVEFKKRDGSTFWGSLSSIMSIGDDGMVYFDGAIRDITKQKEAEEAMKHQAEMQRLLIKISTGYINLPLDKVGDSINESLKELGEFIGADRAYIFDIDFHKKTWSNTYEWSSKGINRKLEKSQNLPISIISDIIDLYSAGESFVVDDVDEMENKEYREILRNQGIKSLITVPIMAGKYCVGFVGVDSVREDHQYKDRDISLLRLFAELMVNIHSRSQNERELSQLLDTTTDQNKRLKDFSYIISHNLRSSVANLIGLSDVLENDPSNKEYMRMLKATSSKLNDAIDHINELLNFEKEITVLKKEYCYLSTTISNVLELNNQIIKEQGISITCNVSNKLRIKGFPVYIESIFQNIITNAIKYGTTSESKCIEISGRKNGNQVVVSVKDFGLGIDLERFKDKIFRLGARFHSKGNQGQGLGLFMTKHQVEAMGGSIEVESEVNKGTTFNVYFNG